MIRIKLPRVRAIDSEQLIIFAYCLLVVISILNTTQFGDIMGYHLIVRGIKYLCTPANIFLFSLNRLLTTRLSLGRQAISTYGFTLFGSETAWVTGRYGIERTEAYFYVDSSYLNIALSFGLVTLLLVMIGFYFLEKKALEEQKYILLSGTLSQSLFSLRCRARQQFIRIWIQLCLVL